MAIKPEAMIAPARVDPLAPPTDRKTSKAPVPAPVSCALRAFWAVVIDPIKHMPMPEPIRIMAIITVHTGAVSGRTASSANPAPQHTHGADTAAPSAPDDVPNTAGAGLG